MSNARQPFFIGWSGKIPRALKPFLSIVCLLLVVGFASGAALVGGSQKDPEGGQFRWDHGPQDLEGIVIGGAYPALWVTKGTDVVPPNQALLLNGNGKTGVQHRINQFDGKLVKARGVIMERGTLRMMQLGGGKRGLSPLDVEPNVNVPEAVPLGRWRVSGEICDGRCVVGAMRPGDGLAHKACANLCISGGQPPIFVATAPIEEDSFFLMMEAGKAPVSDAVLSYTAGLVTVDADISRIGNLTIMTIDPASISRP